MDRLIKIDFVADAQRGEEGTAWFWFNLYTASFLDCVNILGDPHWRYLAPVRIRQLAKIRKQIVRTLDEWFSLSFVNADQDWRELGARWAVVRRELD